MPSTSQLNKYEHEAGIMIHKVERDITSWLKDLGHFPGGPGLKIDSELYYDDAHGISQISPELTKNILARWEYAF